MINISQKILIASLGLSLTINVYANTPPIYLYGTQVPAHNVGKIILDRLYPGAIYNVTCNVDNPYGEKSIMVEFSDSRLRLHPIFYIDGVASNRAVLNKYQSFYEAKQVMKANYGEYLLIMNHSDFNIVMTNCFGNLALD